MGKTDKDRTSEVYVLTYCLVGSVTRADCERDGTDSYNGQQSVEFEAKDKFDAADKVGYLLKKELREKAGLITKLTATPESLVLRRTVISEEPVPFKPEPVQFD